MVDWFIVLYRLFANKKRSAVIALAYATVFILSVLLLSKQEGEEKERLRKTEGVLFSNMITVSVENSKGEKEWISEQAVNDLLQLNGIASVSPVLKMDVTIIYQNGSVPLSIQAVSDDILAYLDILPRVPDLSKDILIIGQATKESLAKKIKFDSSSITNLLVIFDVNEQLEYEAGNKLQPPQKYSFSLIDINEDLSKNYNDPQIMNSSFIRLDMISALVKQGNIQSESLGIKYDEKKGTMLYTDILVNAEKTDEVGELVSILKEKGYRAESVVDISYIGKTDSLKGVLFPLLTAFIIVMSAIFSSVLSIDIINDNQRLLHQLFVLGTTKGALTLSVGGLTGIIACLGCSTGVLGFGLINLGDYLLFERSYYLSNRYIFIYMLIMTLVSTILGTSISYYILKSSNKYKYYGKLYTCDNGIPLSIVDLGK